MRQTILAPEILRKLCRERGKAAATLRGGKQVERSLEDSWIQGTLEAHRCAAVVIVVMVTVRALQAQAQPRELFCTRATHEPSA